MKIVKKPLRDIFIPTICRLVRAETTEGRRTSTSIWTTDRRADTDDSVPRLRGGDFLDNATQLLRVVAAETLILGDAPMSTIAYYDWINALHWRDQRAKGTRVVFHMLFVKKPCARGEHRWINPELLALSAEMYERDESRVELGEKFNCSFS